jgi:hypothetical protein
MPCLTPVARFGGSGGSVGMADLRQGRNSVTRLGDCGGCPAKQFLGAYMTELCLNPLQVRSIWLRVGWDQYLARANGHMKGRRGRVHQARRCSYPFHGWCHQPLPLVERSIEP